MNTITKAFLAVALLSAFVALPAQAACPFSRFSVKAGTSRLELETRIAALLGKANAYSPYGNNLVGGKVSYRSGNCELQVTFAPGAPAPRIALASGSTEHLPPMDETVLSHKIINTASTLQH